ncbi:MAG: tRNA (adenosine(37)-N6)-dimethylallyltransferase MiaA, partial [Coriobacteriales bacterium]|nr:tRNA (adenosine(37)-N6)-dimethylallyltransferase MiaA [Coriobacteriales bacterium]
SFPFTAALYQRHARAAIDDVLARGKTPVLCGGSGLYLRAALDDFRFDEAREIDEARETDEAREALTREAARLGPEAFHALLAERDPRSAALIHPHNVRRVIRAFEFLERQTSYAEQHEGFSSFVSIYPVRLIGLSVEPALLYEAIGRRVDAMLEAGLLDEVRGLLDRGLREASALRQAIGYKELAAALEGHCTLEEAVEQVKQATRRYAKRQRSWFRRDGRIEWIEVSDAHRQLLDGNIDETDFVRLLRKRALMLLQCSEELGPATDTI